MLTVAVAISEKIILHHYIFSFESFIKSQKVFRIYSPMKVLKASFEKEISVRMPFSSNGLVRTLSDIFSTGNSHNTPKKSWL